MASVTVEINAPCLIRWAKATANTQAITEDVYKVWSKMYDSYIRQRFVVYSGGGGDWAALAASTIKQKGSTAILEDTGLLFRSLHPILKEEGEILIAKLELEGTYPSGVNIADVARFHQLGTTRMSAREILVTPDADFQQEMVAAAKKVLYRHLGINDASLFSPHAYLIDEAAESGIGESFASGFELGQILSETVLI